MTSVPTDMHGDLRTSESGETAQPSGAWTAVLLGLAAVAVTSFWVFALFVIIPGLG